MEMDKFQWYHICSGQTSPEEKLKDIQLGKEMIEK